MFAMQYKYCRRTCTQNYGFHSLYIYLVISLPTHKRTERKKKPKTTVINGSRRRGEKGNANVKSLHAGIK